MILQLVNILTQIKESASSLADIHKLVAKAERIIKKRHKLIKIADNRDGWLVVHEYETDDLALDSYLFIYLFATHNKIHNKQA